MSKITKRIDALEEQTDDVGALGREFFELMRAFLNDALDDESVRKQAERLMGRIRSVNERKPDKYLDYLLEFGERLLMEKGGEA